VGRFSVSRLNENNPPATAGGSDRRGVPSFGFHSFLRRERTFSKAKRQRNRSEAPTDGLTDRQQIIDQTIEARRALDLLLAQKEVDRKRVAYVGHDYGSMYGGIMSGVDKRVKAYVLIAGLGKFSPWSLKYWPKTASHGKDAYEQGVASLDPIGYVSRGAPAAFLFQFANTDEYITKDEATAFFDQASKPKEIKWYEAEHDMNVDAARKDRHDWLARQLRLSEPPAVTGG
jgi:pimeloyl-ACP methyl ester carboxylesterase